MNLNSLKDDQLVEYRIGMCGANKIEWKNWQKGNLYLVRRQKDLPNKQSRNRLAGQIITLTIKDAVCPDFGENDFLSDFGYFSCEDWVLEIK